MKYTGILLLSLVMACGPSARQRTIATTLAGLNESSRVFSLYDANTQQSIVANAASKEEGETKLKAWRDKRTVVDSVIVTAYRALTVAALADDNPTLQSALVAAGLVARELADLGVKLP